MEVNEQFAQTGRIIRLAFNQFMCNNGYRLARECAEIDRPGMGYKNLAKWLPAKSKTVLSKKYKPEINNWDQLHKLVECVSECVRACGWLLADGSGKEVDKITETDIIPFYDADKKCLITIRIDSSQAGTLRLSFRKQFEFHHPFCRKYLMLQADVKGIRKSFVYCNDKDLMATIFPENSEEPVKASFSTSNMESFVINSGTDARDYVFQIIFQRTNENTNFFCGVYSAFEAKSGYPTCGRVFLIKSGADIRDDDTLLQKTYEYLLFNDSELKKGGMAR